jgi:hypothetical protein
MQLLQIVSFAAFCTFSLATPMDIQSTGICAMKMLQCCDSLIPNQSGQSPFANLPFVGGLFGGGGGSDILVGQKCEYFLSEGNL